MNFVGPSHKNLHRSTFAAAVRAFGGPRWPLTGGAPIGGRVRSLREGVTPVSAPRDRPDRGFASGARTSRPPHPCAPRANFLAKAPRAFGGKTPTLARRLDAACSPRVFAFAASRARAVTVGSPRSDPPEGRFAILVAARARPSTPASRQQISIALPAILVLVAARATSARLARDPHGASDPLRFRGRIQRRHRRGGVASPTPRARRAPRRARAQPPRATPHRQRSPPGRRDVLDAPPGPGPRAPRAQPRRRRRRRASARALHAELRLHRAPMGPRHGLHQHRRRRRGRA